MELKERFHPVKAIVATGLFSKSLVYDAIDRGELEAIRSGRNGRAIRVSDSALQRWIESRSTGCDQQAA